MLTADNKQIHTKRQHEQHQQQKENIQGMPLSDAVQKVMDGTFRDGKTALALLMVQQLLSAPCKQ